MRLRSVSQSTVPVAVESSTTRPHARNCVSPGGRQAAFPENHSFPFSQTESRMRSSFVATEIRRPPFDTVGCGAFGGATSWRMPGVATSVICTGAGGMPVTARRCTTDDRGLSTETTYSVEVDESDCTGAKLE